MPCLPFQLIIFDAASRKFVFYDGLISIRDPKGRIITAGQFIVKGQEHETGRLIDCLALDMGLRSLVGVSIFSLS